VISDWFVFSSSSSSSFSISGCRRLVGNLGGRQGRARIGRMSCMCPDRQSAIFHHAALPDSRTRTTSAGHYTSSNQSTLDFCAG
jgi:hypothetical protein